MLSKVTRRFLNYHQYYAFASTHGEGHQKQLSASDEQYLQEVRKRYVTPDMEKWAYLEYKKHPSAYLSHYDPKSKDYVESERDEYNAQVATNSHNSLIDQFKQNLKTQRKVHDILQKMDRPYLRGVPGVTKNISAGLQDYTNPVDLKSNVDHNDFYRDAYKNENRWIDQNTPTCYIQYQFQTFINSELTTILKDILFFAFELNKNICKAEKQEQEDLLYLFCLFDFDLFPLVLSASDFSTQLYSKLHFYCQNG